MSDQGDAGQWRPTSRNNEHEAAEETTGPIPAVPRDEAAEQGFPPPGGAPDSWSADDESTGGFPSVPVEPPSFSTRAPFEPADESPAYESEPGDDVWNTGGSKPAETHDADPYEVAEQPPAVEEQPAESSFSYGTPDDTPSYEFPTEKTYGREEFSYAPPEEPALRGLDALSAEAPPRYGGMPDTAPRGGQSTDDDQDEEFFAQDDHPPMWDKVVAPAGPPPKPGKPSSGNLRLPEWMRDENNGGGHPGPTPGASGGFEEEGGSKKGLYAGVALLVAGLVAVGGVYVLRGGGTTDASHAASPTKSSKRPSSPPAQQPTAPQVPEKVLGRFKGVHTAPLGRVSDPRAGLSYPKFGQPWALAPRTSPMAELGFNVSQFAVTEKAAGRPKRWARLMSAQLGGAEKGAYTGPGSERETATLAASSYEARMYGFRHRKKLLASQPLEVGGHKGWLVGYYLTYNRPGSQATGDVVAVAVMNTGKPEPGVLFMSVPNTNRKLWPDVNYVVRQLRVM